MIRPFAELGIEIRVDGPAEQRVPCPQCGKSGRDDALGVNIESGVFNCFRCSWRGRAGDTTSDSSPASRQGERRGRRMPDGSRLESIWQRTLPLRGSVGETYLQHRRCNLPPKDADLRFLPSSERHAPSLCARVTDALAGTPLTLHFTRLRADGRGKAGTDRDKLLLKDHPKAGGVIRLWPDDTVTTALGIAEGIETALAAAHAFRPVWSCIDAGNLARFPVLRGIESLMIFGDNDESGKGQAAADECAQRWADAGREVRVVMPELPGDIADAVAA